MVLQPMGWDLTMQIELYNYILICIFPDQSEQLHNDQSKHMIPTNQDSGI